ncbi:MAG: hypothetical protein LBG15_11545 [Dysgonamonadaceae bacterium]|jgi:hypothetical protein|nr:hypothetical protein [Dysgonamonadaceae bacterium]
MSYERKQKNDNKLVMKVRTHTSVKSNTHVNQYTDYYLFGMPYASSSYLERQPYKFGGEEPDGTD